MKNLYRLVYTSARLKSCTDEEIDNILKSCRKNNTKRKITGMLIHTDKRFLQVLEGDKEEIESLYLQIKSDSRHGGVMQRSFSEVDSRIFSEWHMAYKDITSDELEYATFISNSDKKQFKDMVHGNSSASYDNKGIRIIRTFLSAK